MSNKIIEESILEDIGDAIRQKRNVTTRYKPSQMPTAIQGIESFPEPTGAINITHNGIVGVKNYASANVQVEPEFDEGDEGKVVSNGALVAQTSTTKTSNGTYDTTTNDEVVINVPNTYSASDEGKVVDSGALVVQGSQTITENGTYDTTLISELIANIAGGGGGGIKKEFLYEFNESQGNVWINTEIDVSDIDTFLFEDVRSDDVVKSVVIDVADIAVYTGGTDVYTPIYTQTKPMNVRIYNGYLYVSYSGVGASTNVTKVYKYSESSGGGAKNILGGATIPTSADGNNGDIYLQHGLPDTYDALDYIQSSGTQYITFPYKPTTKTEAEIKLNLQNIGEAAIFGSAWAVNGFFLMTYQNAFRWHEDGSHIINTNAISLNTDYVVKASFNGLDVNGTNYPSISTSDPDGHLMSVFTASSPQGAKGSFKLYYFKLWDGGSLSHWFVPAKRKSDDAIGLYDILGGEFYTNAGTGTFSYGNTVDYDGIRLIYLKNGGSWLLIEGQDWDDVNTEGSGGAKNILSGTDAPTASVGSDGDIYLQCLNLLQELVSQESELQISVTANSNWSGFEPWKAFSLSYAWIGGGGNPHWLQIEFPSAISIYTMYFYVGDSNRAHAISRIGYSDDGTNFTDVALAESTMTNNEGHVTLERACKAKYFRLYFDGDYGASYYPMIGKLEIYGEGDSVTYSYCKVNGAWQNLIGTDIDDVNTGE